MTLSEEDLEAIRAVFRQELREALKGAPPKKNAAPAPKPELVGKYASADDLVTALWPGIAAEEPDIVRRGALWRRAAWDHGFPESAVLNAVHRLVPKEPVAKSGTSLATRSATFGRATDAAKEAKPPEATDEERLAALGVAQVSPSQLGASAPRRTQHEEDP